VPNQCSIAFSEKNKGTIFTGGSDGMIYVWNNDTVVKTVQNNKGSVYSVACRTDDAAKGEVVIVGGSDKSVTIYRYKDGLTKVWMAQVDSAPRSVDLFNGNFLFGYKNGNIATMKWSEDGKAK
jgi:WD40 repeat protein